MVKMQYYQTKQAAQVLGYSIDTIYKKLYYDPNWTYIKVGGKVLIPRSVVDRELHIQKLLKTHLTSREVAYLLGRSSRWVRLRLKHKARYYIKGRWLWPINVVKLN